MVSPDRGHRHSTQRGTAGEPIGFDDFVRSEHVKLVRFVATLGASWEEAEDAVAQALTDAFVRWQGIREPRAYLRKSSERAYVNSQVRLRDAPRRAAMSAWAVSHEAMPEAHDFIDHDDALRHLRRLNQEQRRVMAYVYDGYRPEEIAEILEKKSSTVRSNIRHARAALREAVFEERAAEARAQAQAGAPQMSSTSRRGEQT